MKLIALVLPIAFAAAPAIADTEPGIACSVQASAPQGQALQEGQVVMAQIAAVSQTPIDSLEVNGIRIPIRHPKSLLLRTEAVRLLTPGETSVKVRVGYDYWQFADCESEAIVVEPKPVCGEGQVQEAVAIQQTFTEIKLVPVAQTVLRTQLVCVDVSSGHEDPFTKQ